MSAEHELREQLRHQVDKVNRTHSMMGLTVVEYWDLLMLANRWLDGRAPSLPEDRARAVNRFHHMMHELGQSKLMLDHEKPELEGIRAALRAEIVKRKAAQP